jgi:hypothetical protein
MIRHRTMFVAALPLAACLYTGNGTEGLPCRTDAECGGAQTCIAQVCGGPSTSSEGSSGESDSGSESSSDGGSDEGIRDMCGPADTQCLDGNVLQLCTEDGKLSTRECAGWCGQASPSNGCFTQPEGGDTCYCEDERAPCSAAQEYDYECHDNNLRQCDGAFWTPLDCDSICVDAGYVGADSCGPTETGSGTCFCNTSCVEGSLRCVDGNTAAQCNGGTWTNYDCNDLCVENGKTFSPGCDFFYDADTESCGCV